jgi:hypothetical protein
MANLLHNHAPGVAAMASFVVSTIGFKHDPSTLAQQPNDLLGIDVRTGDDLSLHLLGTQVQRRGLPD